MDALIKTYKETGKLSHEQLSLFIKPSDEILNMILESDDFNFRKTCLNAIIDSNTDDVILSKYREFIKNPIVKDTLKSILIKK